MLKSRSSRVDGRMQAMMSGLLQDRIVRRIPDPQRSTTPSPSTWITHTHTQPTITPGTHQTLPKLAQGSGAGPRGRRRLNADEWMQVKFRSLMNGNSARPCVICSEEFRLQPQVLLSCSHVFHTVCMRKLEVSSGRNCPQCGTEQYETRVIDDGARIYREKCALRIQAWWRGCVTRRRYQDMRKRVPPKDPQFRCRFFKEKLQEMNENMLQMLHMDMEMLLQDMDMNMAHFRHVMQKLSVRVPHTFRDVKDEWSEAEEKALERDACDCPICLSPLRSTKVVLLSCSHLFHRSCLREFESACRDQDVTCPLCRRQYVSAPVRDSTPLSYRIHAKS